MNRQARTIIVLISLQLCLNVTLALTSRSTCESTVGRRGSHTDKLGAQNQIWSYVDVRPCAHMFYWMYHTTSPEGFKNVPLVMWLQGGPGGSSTGFGNFGEIGPMNISNQPRKTTWLSAASLLFVDNPVGAGYSYAENDEAFTTDVEMIAQDLMVVLTQFFMKDATMFQDVPFFIFSESYGGKMTAVVSKALHMAIQSDHISCNFKGFAMGDSWISPMDSTAAWAPYLYTTSLIDKSGFLALMKESDKVGSLISLGRWTNATAEWGNMQEVVERVSGGVNFYNIEKWGGSLDSTLYFGSSLENTARRVLEPYHVDSLSALMNGPIKKYLGVIPENVTWGAQSEKVFAKQAEDFMKPVIEVVDDLIQNSPLDVVVYSGQLDLIVNTIGTENWVYTLNVAEKFMAAKRNAMTMQGHVGPVGFVQTAGNFSFYWILGAGHMVPSDQGDTALKMLKMIINRPDSK